MLARVPSKGTISRLQASKSQKLKNSMAQKDAKWGKPREETNQPCLIVPPSPPILQISPKTPSSPSYPRAYRAILHTCSHTSLTPNDLILPLHLLPKEHWLRTTPTQTLTLKKPPPLSQRPFMLRNAKPTCIFVFHTRHLQRVSAKT